MKVTIPYGKDRIQLKIPDENILDVVESGREIQGGSEEKIISEALSNPIKSQKLSELAVGKKSACILASDISRPCPSYKFLPHLARELNEGGVENKNIKIILGLGIHRKHTADEQKKLVGETIYENIRVMDSDIGSTELIGNTPSGTPVEVFSEALGNDLLIATGNIEYHYFAGYSGGAKALMPGTCTRNSIQANHSMMLDDRAMAGRYKDNPVRMDIEEAGKLIGIDFIFNVILDDKKNIINAVAGKNNDAWLEGIKRYDSIYRKEVNSRADMVIVSPGGFPKDINLYQSQKALDNVKNIAADGGTIIVIASCCEGFGEDIFECWMADARDYELISGKLKEKFVLGGHKAVAISKVISKKEVYLYSDFSKEATEKMGFKKLEDIQDFINQKIKAKKELKITVVPNGRFVTIKNNQIK